MISPSASHEMGWVRSERILRRIRRHTLREELDALCDVSKNAEKHDVPGADSP
jgi:hypothetical protein